MQREERKRPCKMSRETILRQLVNTFITCPLQSFSIEANHFSASAVIELTQNITKGLFPQLSHLDIDGFPVSPLLTARQQLQLRKRGHAPSDADHLGAPAGHRGALVLRGDSEWVVACFDDALDVIKHNHGEDTPFRYNFETRYPSDCKFYCTCE